MKRLYARGAAKKIQNPARHAETIAENVYFRAMLMKKFPETDFRNAAAS